MIKNRKKLAVVIAIVILTLSLASTGFAANTMKTLQAYYRNITIFRNGTQASFSHEPFIVDGTTYVPVRDMSQLLGKTVTFNPQTYRIDITDTPDANTVALQTKMIQQEIEITNLNNKIKELEAKLAEKTSTEVSKSTLSEMQKYLNNNYDEFRNVEFEFELSSKKNTITVGMFVDLDYDEAAWNKITNNQLKGFIQDVVDEIEEEFDYDVEGFIEDIASDEELVGFYLDNRGNLVVDYEGVGSGSSSTTLTRMASLLNNEYKKTSNGITNIKLSITRGDIYLDVYVTTKTWNGLSENTQMFLLEDMYDYIRDENFTETVYGNIYSSLTSTNPIDTFGFDKNGYVIFD